MELLLGCGHKRDKRIFTYSSDQWKELVTLDINPEIKPDYLFDLSTIGKPWATGDDVDCPIYEDKQLPFSDSYFDEIHAYEVLEHIGQQGDYKTFFAQFTEFHRILKPNGLFCATVPVWNKMWAWGDPSHTRIINEGTIAFLSQKEYERQAGVSTMTDFRYIYKADFDILMAKEQDMSFVFVLKAIKNEKP